LRAGAQWSWRPAQPLVRPWPEPDAAALAEGDVAVGVPDAGTVGVGVGVGAVVTVQAPGRTVIGFVEVVVAGAVVLTGLIVIGPAGTVTVVTVGGVIVTVWPLPMLTLTPTGVVLVEVDVGALATAVVTVGAVEDGVVVADGVVGLDALTG
jgi:hypothetical protein